MVSGTKYYKDSNQSLSSKPWVGGTFSQVEATLAHPFPKKATNKNFACAYSKVILQLLVNS